MVHEMKDLVSQESELSAAKILYKVKNLTHVITAEVSGRVRIVRIEKTFFGIYNHITSSLYEEALKKVCSIEV